MFWKKKGESAPKPAPEPRKSGGSAGSAGASDTGGDAGSPLLTGDSNLDGKSVELLLAVIARISQASDLESKLTEIVDRSIEFATAERGLLILADATGQPIVRVARSREGQNLGADVRFSSSIVKKVLDENRPRKATVNSDSEALDLGRSVYDLKLRAVMCVPISTPPPPGEASGGPQRGALYIDSRAATREFTERDLSLFAALSTHISIALQNERLHLDSLEKTRLEQSLELASAVQNSLMPQVPKDRPGWDLAGWYRPAERTSGDFFDFVSLKTSKLAVVIGDVSGHGIGPALITASAQGSLRSYLRVGQEPAQALGLLNQDLCERDEAGMFLTLLLVVLSNDGRCDLLNAGHHGPLVWRAKTRSVESVDAHGPALGWVAETPYSIDASIELEKGDVLLAFTDGLIESHAPGDRDRLFGIERLRMLLGELASHPHDAQTISRSIAEAALSFSAAKHEDDITLVVVKKA
ncbi:MAG: SpoIIE family protein phosphatase [Planctomycetes bacterium]|nr:SpoIIE family protein phosphatase [Planctomycetota bacterium]